MTHLVLLHLALHAGHERVQRVSIISTVDLSPAAVPTAAALELCQQGRLRACILGGLQTRGLLCDSGLEAPLVGKQQVPA